MNKNIYISTHAVFTSEGQPLYGTGSALEDYLLNKNINFVVTKFPIIGTSAISQSVINKKKYEKKLKFRQLPLLLNSVQEFFILYRSLQDKKKIDVFIGVNPLNAIYGIFLKKMGKVNKVIFYTADYAIKRFENSFLNLAYHSIDRYAAKKSDQVWNISLRIVDVRRKQGINENKIFFVPNAPPFFGVKQNNNRHDLIVVSSSPTATNLTLIFQTLKEIIKKYPDVKLKIVGLGNWEEKLNPQMRELGIKKNVVFYSNLPHDKLLDLLKTAGVGIALYTNQSPWTYYADSMKVRDYLACGLPVIITDVIGTAADIKEYNSGYVISMSKSALINSLDNLFADDVHYSKLRGNAIKLAKTTDINKIFDKILLTLL